ncbi:hypothetical protein A5320_04945 [Rheinheimera sp. SA_1]|nr:hypothetical protein A5320_04945 [Rheinheimera sp. SA_1]
MSVINQMLRDLDKQQPAAGGALAAGSVAAGSVISTANGAAGSGKNLLRPLLFLLLAGFIGWLIWPLVQARLQEPVPVAVSVPQTEPKIVPKTELVLPPVVTTATTIAEPTVVATPQPEPITATKKTAGPVIAEPVAAVPKIESPDAATPIIETPALESDSEVYPATPEPDLSAQTETIKQPSSMQVEKVLQDPKVLAAEQARAQQLQQLQQLLQGARQASQRQQWQQTLDLLQQISPEFANADSWQLQANARQQLGDFSGALASWQQLLLLKPQLAQAWLGKALAHDQLAQLPEARAAYQQAYALPGLSAASRQFIQQRLAQ